MDNQPVVINRLDFGWKRIAIRTACMTCVLGSCLTVPNFKPVLSIVGGVPMIILTIHYPFAIHWKLFELTYVKKLGLLLMLSATTVMTVGNFVIGVNDIAQVILHAHPTK